MIDDATAEGRRQILARMQAASRAFYYAAANAGCHAFIEFTGLMNEFIKLCEEAEARGIDWLHANVHGDAHLPFRAYHIAYLNEKLACIYGASIAVGVSEHARDDDGIVEAIAAWIERRADLMRRLGAAHEAEGYPVDARRSADEEIVLRALVATLRVGSWQLDDATGEP